MNQVPEERKDSMTKTLAILGFLAIIILIVWLAVKVVALIPGAFSSLASIADSVYSRNTNSELIVTTENSIVNAGESFVITWNKMSGEGSYGFEYECKDGVTLDIRQRDGGVKNVDCGEFVDLDDAAAVNVLINAKTQRFTDVEYSVTFTREGAENLVGEGIITVVNTSIPTGVTVVDETDTEPEPVQNETEQRPTPTSPQTPSTPTPTAGTPTVVTNYIYKIPESDPKGKIDLQVTHLGVGTMKNGVFTPTAKLEEDVSGAVRFEIKNIGTKTSDSWSYEAELPSDISYESGSQKALKPNERVVITLGFDGITRTGTETIKVDVTASGDINKANNNYTWAVQVVK